MKIAIKSLGYPEFNKYSDNCIVDTMSAHIGDMERIQKKIDVLDQVGRFIADADNDANTAILNG